MTETRQTHGKDGRPLKVSDGETLAALRELYEAGERDALEGGVTSTRLAEEIGLSRHRTVVRLRRLCGTGDVARVWGVPPDEWPPTRPRISYAPVEDVDRAAGDGGRFEQ